MEAGESDIQDHFWPHRESEANLVYIRPCLEMKRGSWRGVTGTRAPASPASSSELIQSLALNKTGDGGTSLSFKCLGGRKGV